jgi:hypothetical protein
MGDGTVRGDTLRRGVVGLLVLLASIGVFVAALANASGPAVH